MFPFRCHLISFDLICILQMILSKSHLNCIQGILFYQFIRSQGIEPMFLVPCSAWATVKLVIMVDGWFVLLTFAPGFWTEASLSVRTCSSRSLCKYTLSRKPVPGPISSWYLCHSQLQVDSWSWSACHGLLIVTVSIERWWTVIGAQRRQWISRLCWFERSE